MTTTCVIAAVVRTMLKSINLSIVLFVLTITSSLLFAGCGAQEQQKTDANGRAEESSTLANDPNSTLVNSTNVNSTNVNSTDVNSTLINSTNVNSFVNGTNVDSTLPSDGAEVADRSANFVQNQTKNVFDVGPIEVSNRMFGSSNETIANRIDSDNATAASNATVVDDDDFMANVTVRIGDGAAENATSFDVAPRFGFEATDETNSTVDDPSSVTTRLLLPTDVDEPKKNESRNGTVDVTVDEDGSFRVSEWINVTQPGDRNGTVRSTQQTLLTVDVKDKEDEDERFDTGDEQVPIVNLRMVNFFVEDNGRVQNATNVANYNVQSSDNGDDYGERRGDDYGERRGDNASMSTLNGNRIEIVGDQLIEHYLEDGRSDRVEDDVKGNKTHNATVSVEKKNETSAASGNETVNDGLSVRMMIPSLDGVVDEETVNSTNSSEAVDRGFVNNTDGDLLSFRMMNDWGESNGNATGGERIQFENATSDVNATANGNDSLDGNALEGNATAVGNATGEDGDSIARNNGTESIGERMFNADVEDGAASTTTTMEPTTGIDDGDESVVVDGSQARKRRHVFH